MGQIATPHPAALTLAQTAPQAAVPAAAPPPSAGAPSTTSTRSPFLPGGVDAMDAGIGLATAGFLGFVLCRLVLHHHWTQVKADPTAHPTGAIWTDVLVRLISYICIFLLGIGVILIAARLAGRI